MEDELETIKETAKAVQEASKAGKALVDATSDLGKFVARVLGTVPEDIVGLSIGDYLREIRTRNLDKIRRKTDEILRRRKVEKPKSISPKQAIPAFKAMADESDETLQDIWARLLANAMDPNRDVQLQQIFIDTLRAFEPLDALILDKLKSDKSGEHIHKAIPGDIRQSLIQLSLDRLMKLECVRIAQGWYYLRALGDELWTATRDNG